LPQFWYKAVTGSGAVAEGWIEAPSEVVVEEELRRKGEFLISVEERAKKKKVTDGKIDRKELLAMLEYLSGSFAAGIPLLATLDDVPKRLRSPKLKTIIGEVRFAVAEEGKSLSDALAEHPLAFPTLFVSTIQAGEASGQLSFALQQLVEYLDWQETIGASVRQATMYPIVVMVAISLLVAGLLGFVFPRIVPILRMRGGALPLPTRMVMGLSEFVREGWWIILLALVVVSVIVWLMRRTDAGRMALDSAILKIPAVGEFILEVNMARVVTYLGLFYRTGVDLLHSLLLVEQMTTNRVVGRVVRDARELIAGGESIASAFGRSPYVPVVVMRSLALGEQTGRLDESLERAKLYYAREIPAAVRRVVTLIQPTMIIILGSVILTVALAIMLPILNIYNTIGVRR
jgi:type II secretory pathway component PulF